MHTVSKLGRLADTDEDPYKDKELTDMELAKKLLANGVCSVEDVFSFFSLNCTSVNDIDYQKIEALIARFEESGRSDAEILARIIALFRTAPKQPSDNMPVIAAIKKHIEEHLCEDFRISDLADSLNISVYYLCHMFKAATGITVTDYCNSLRITKAKQLLVNTDDSINDIAQRCGFCTAAYFAEMFSRTERISPTEYRRIHKTE
jgi:AraC-like DNA-binding protein